MLRILLAVLQIGLLTGSVCGQIIVPWDADVRVLPQGPMVHQNNRAIGVGHSYYWGDPKLGQGLPGWSFNDGFGMQQGASSSFSGTGIVGTGLNGYPLWVRDQTVTPFVTSVIPVVGNNAQAKPKTSSRPPKRVAKPTETLSIESMIQRNPE